jgi:predicted membrane protein
MAYRRLSSQSLLGGVVVLVGLVLLLQTTGTYDVGPLFRFVPALFVLIGLYALVTSGLQNVVGPLVLVGFGTVWQLVALDYLRWTDVVSLWPALIILFGLSILLGRVRPKARTVDGTRMDVVAIFGGRNVRADSKQFTGGEVTVAFGGADVDLRDVVVPAPPARLDVTSAFGGVEIAVPRDWRVRLDVLPLFGAAEDDRPRRETEHETVDLVVTGICAFGGVSVTD